MELIDLLLAQNITNIDQQDFQGNTIMHRAVLTQNERLVEALINKGASVRIRNRKGELPLSLAKTGAVEELLNVALAIQQV
jgi:ankyrin repeat protein